MNGAELIVVERKRQLTQKGWTVEHDVTEHEDGSLYMAAVAVSVVGTGSYFEYSVRPKDSRWIDALVDKHAAGYTSTPDRVKALAIAGALIAAEIDRLQAVPVAPLVPT